MAYTIEELIDVVQGDLSISCSLPKLLPDVEIERIITNEALGYFNRSYPYALHKIYLYLPKEHFYTEKYTMYKYIELPCEVQNVVWLYEVRNASLFNIGINAPNLSVGLGVTNQPYLSSYVTTVGELGIYKVVLDSFSDMLNQLSKYTLKNHFNKLDHRLHILTKVEYDVVLEVYVSIEQEALFTDDLFIKWVIGRAKQQQAAIMGRFNFKLPGGIQYNYADLASEGKEQVQKVEDEIKGISNASFFIMTKK